MRATGFLGVVKLNRIWGTGTVDTNFMTYFANRIFKCSCWFLMTWALWGAIESLVLFETQAAVQDQKKQVHWGYQGGTQPEQWGKLSPEFALCDSGMRQSPINIDRGRIIKKPLVILSFPISQLPQIL